MVEWFLVVKIWVYKNTDDISTVKKPFDSEKACKEYRNDILEKLEQANYDSNMIDIRCYKKEL